MGLLMQKMLGRPRKKYNTTSMTSKKQTLAYICHPISGDVERNLQSIRYIVRNINTQEPYTTPFVPYYADVVSMNDSDPEQRRIGLNNCMEAIMRCPIDQLRVYGERLSDGMRMEIQAAARKGVMIVCYNLQVYMQIKYELPPESRFRVVFTQSKFPLLVE